MEWVQYQNDCTYIGMSETTGSLTTIVSTNTASGTASISCDTAMQNNAATCMRVRLFHKYKITTPVLNPHYVGGSGWCASAWWWYTTHAHRPTAVLGGGVGGDTLLSAMLCRGYNQERLAVQSDLRWIHRPVCATYQSAIPVDEPCKSPHKRIMATTFKIETIHKMFVVLVVVRRHAVPRELHRVVCAIRRVSLVWVEQRHCCPRHHVWHLIAECVNMRACERFLRK
jgi:hypothetical protein